MDVNRIIVGTALALGCLLLAAGGGALYRHAVVLPGEQADKQALEAHQRTEVYAREVDRTVNYARCLGAVGSGSRATQAEHCQKLGQGAGCELPQDMASAVGRQHERGEVQCFNEAKIGL
ncbi:hypothetical protein [Acidovorax sp.]|uniref:hypothetical protein n=1 Tax=Acidovorax sp. TaxID=1872122 RepID=UPI003D063C88